MSEPFSIPVDRRRFLASRLLAATSGWTLSGQNLFAADDKDPWKGFQMGIQSYSLRGFAVDKALQVSQKLGLLYWETFPGHVKVGTVPAYVAEQRELLKKSGVNLVAYGVV